MFEAEQGPDAREERSVVIGCGLTAVKIFIRLRLQKFVSPISPQPLVRVEGMLSTPEYISKGRG